MSDLKISQLPAASTPLAGTELLELVQAGTNVQSTVSTVLAGVAVIPAQLNAGTIPAAAGTALWLQRWHMLVFDGQTGAVPTIAAGRVYGTAPSGGWGGNTGFGTFTVDNPTAASIWLAMQRVQQTSAAAINSQAELSDSSSASNTSYRKVGASSLIAGFELVWTGSFVANKSDQTVFVGFNGTAGALGGSVVPSAVLNSFGFGKDSGDANLQFMVNNGTGSATKTDTGISMASIQAHLVRISVVCDPAGALCTAVFQDLESGGAATKTFTVADGATKNIVTNTPVYPHIYVGTGPSTATAVTIGHSSIFAQFSFLQ